MKTCAGIIIAAFVLSQSSFALDDADIQKRIKDLKNADPKIRAAAITELMPVYMDLMLGLTESRTDASPEVIQAHQAAERQMVKRLQKAQAAFLATPQGMAARMAANETAAAANCKAYAEAQEIYHRTDWDGDGVLEYAQAMSGDNSLLDKKEGDNVVGLIDKAFAQAEGEPGKATPKAGYYFKILTKVAFKQRGANANPVKQTKDLMVGGNMTLGYALIAYPAEYGVTGKDCYMISNLGTIWHKDLGAETHAILRKMTEFDTEGWVPVE